jgi:acetyltransferase-like isoleucine patch superfamily enzyme
MGKEDLKRMTQCVGYSSEDKSIKRWQEVKSLRKVLVNYLVITFCKLLPDIKFKSRLYRRIGMKIGRNASIFGPNLDIFFPELIEIGDNTVVGNNVSIMTHEFLINGWKKGPVKIGRNVMVGTMTLILPGVEIGDRATIAAYSLVNKSVKPGTLVGGVPIKELKRKGKGTKKGKVR